MISRQELARARATTQGHWLPVGLYQPARSLHRRTVESNAVNERGGALVSAQGISDASESAHNVNILTKKKKKVMSLVSYVGRYEAPAVTRLNPARILLSAIPLRPFT